MLSSGGGAFSAWMARRTRGEVIGVDISDAQLAHARKRLETGNYPNLRFIEYDVMQIAGLDEPPFDAAVYLDAACYLPDKHAALKGIAAKLKPGAKMLLVDWCRSERATMLQKELLLEPFYRYWHIPEMETVGSYKRAFRKAGFHLSEFEDLTVKVAPNWERGYAKALDALADPLSPKRFLQVAEATVKYGTRAARLAKEQFYAAMFLKAVTDAGLFRYVYFLVERKWIVS